MTVDQQAAVVAYYTGQGGGFVSAPRAYRGNMCGVRVPGLPPVPGGAADASLVLSWFYGRYAAADRARIRAAWKARGDVDVLVSWPDDRGYGLSAQEHAALCRELLADGFRPCDMLLSKDFDPPTVAGCLANLAPVLPLLIGLLPRMCIGWELNLWLSPETLRVLIDTLAPQFVPGGTKCYVHFSEGVSSWQVDGEPFAGFWNRNVGKLTGLLRQEILAQTPNERRWASGGIVDVLQRFAGGFGVVPDSGFGHPFDDIELEISAMDQFNGTCTEAQGDALGQWALETPPQFGPAGWVSVMGSGNGQQR